MRKAVDVFAFRGLRIYAACGVLVIPWVVGVEPAAAQDAAQTSDVGLQEIVVTAQRREDTLQRTPLAIEALSASDLALQGITDVRDLAASVPSLHIAELGLFSNVYINGVGGGVSNLYGSPAVSYSIDGVFIDQASAPSSALYDLQRLEIVKGPQGTLYGRNATAGALNVIPNKPSFTEEGSVSVQYGSYHDTEFSGMANIPLSSTVTTRFAFKTVRHDGYLSNGDNDEDSQAGRAQILWQASDALTLQGYADYFHEGGTGGGSIPLYPGASLNGFGTGPIAPGLPPGQRYLNPNNPWTGVSTQLLYPSLIPPPYPSGVPLAGTDAGVDHKQGVFHVQADWDLGFATATLIPSYVTISDNSIHYEAGFRAHEVDDINQYTVEARLASPKGDADRRLQWVGGLFYFASNGSALGQYFQQGFSDIDLDSPQLSDESKAAFGQITYSVIDSLRLTGGLRYTKENKSEAGQTIVGNIFLAPPPTPATCAAPFTYYAPYSGSTPEPARCGLPNAGNLNFSSTDYKAGIEYDVSPQNLVYVNYSTGFKAGGFNPGGPPNTYPPERLKDLDVGSKNRFFDNRLQLNSYAFYWSYDNQQIQAFGPLNPSGYGYIVYPSKSHIFGGSLSATALATEVDKIDAEIVYTYGVYDKYQTAAIAPLGVPAVNGDGTERPYTPKWTEHLAYTHTFKLPGGGTVPFNLNTNIVGRQYIYNTPYVALANQSSYHKSNATLGYSSANGLWSTDLYVNNIENAFTLNSLQLGTTTNNFFGYPDPPRTFGVRISRKFN
jgi:iron complex outermembrane receptor protein